MASMLLMTFLLLAFLGFSTSAKVPLSIDCGSSESSTDINGRNWVSDSDYVNSGESKAVPSGNSLSQEQETLRLFKTGTKNCYSIKVNKGEKVLVRASFYYGNYDGKQAPPTFDLELNGNIWANVETVLSTDTYIFYEAILVVPGGDLSVCLIQTIKGQYPFISALEVQSLDANMYSHVDSHLSLYLRTRSSASNTDQIGYPDDVYNRYWLPTTLAPTISNSLLTIDVAKAEDNPPESALQNAVTSLSTALPIEISDNKLPSVEMPVYINMYFSELVELESTDKRSFHVFMDDKRLTTTPIIPPYESVKQMTFTKISASSATVFSFKATPDSTLPPIINAFELFVYSNNSVNATSVPKSNSSKNPPHPSFLAIWAIVGVMLLNGVVRTKKD